MDILKVAIEVGGKRYERDLNVEAQIQVNPEGLTEAIATTPARIAEWGMLVHMSQVVYDDLKASVELLEGELKTIEAELTLEFAGRGKVDEVKAMVQNDPKRRLAAQRVAEMKEAARGAYDQLGTCKVGLRSMEAKHEAGIALGYQQRREQDRKDSINVAAFRPGAGAKQG